MDRGYQSYGGMYRNQYSGGRGSQSSSVDMNQIGSQLAARALQTVKASMGIDEPAGFGTGNRQTGYGTDDYGTGSYGMGYSGGGLGTDYAGQRHGDYGEGMYGSGQAAHSDQYSQEQYGQYGQAQYGMGGDAQQAGYDQRSNTTHTSEDFSYSGGGSGFGGQRGGAGPRGRGETPRGRGRGARGGERQGPAGSARYNQPPGQSNRPPDNQRQLPNKIFQESKGNQNAQLQKREKTAGQQGNAGQSGNKGPASAQKLGTTNSGQPQGFGGNQPKNQGPNRKASSQSPALSGKKEQEQGLAQDTGKQKAAPAQAPAPGLQEQSKGPQAQQGQQDKPVESKPAIMASAKASNNAEGPKKESPGAVPTTSQSQGTKSWKGGGESESESAQQTEKLASQGSKPSADSGGNNTADNAETNTSERPVNLRAAEEEDDSGDEDTSFCKLCNMPFAGPEQYFRHTRGLLHTQRQMAADDAKKAKTDTPKPSTSSQEPQASYSSDGAPGQGRGGGKERGGPGRGGARGRGGDSGSGRGRGGQSDRAQDNYGYGQEGYGCDYGYGEEGGGYGQEGDYGQQENYMSERGRGRGAFGRGRGGRGGGFGAGGDSSGFGQGSGVQKMSAASSSQGLAMIGGDYDYDYDYDEEEEEEEEDYEDDDYYEETEMDEVTMQTIAISKMKDSDDYHCKLCDIKTTGAVTFRAHINGRNHKLVQEAVDKGTPIPRRLHNKLGPAAQIPKSQFMLLASMKTVAVDGPSQLVKVLKDIPEAIVGLKCVKEYQVGKQPTFLCTICDSQCDLSSIQTHLLGSKHRLKYLKEYHPDVYEHVRTHGGRKSQLSAFLEEVCSDIEQKEGRGAPIMEQLVQEEKDEEKKGGKEQGGGKGDDDKPPPWKVPHEVAMARYKEDKRKKEIKEKREELGYPPPDLLPVHGDRREPDRDPWGYPPPYPDMRYPGDDPWRRGYPDPRYMDSRYSDYSDFDIPAISEEERNRRMFAFERYNFYYPEIGLSPAEERRHMFMEYERLGVPYKVACRRVRLQEDRIYSVMRYLREGLTVDDARRRVLAEENRRQLCMAFERYGLSPTEAKWRVVVEEERAKLFDDYERRGLLPLEARERIMAGHDRMALIHEYERRGMPPEEARRRAVEEEDRLKRHEERLRRGIVDDGAENSTDRALTSIAEQKQLENYMQQGLTREDAKNRVIADLKRQGVPMQEAIMRADRIVVRSDLMEDQEKAAEAAIRPREDDRAVSRDRDPAGVRRAGSRERAVSWERTREGSWPRDKELGDSREGLRPRGREPDDERDRLVGRGREPNDERDRLWGRDREPNDERERLWGRGREPNDERDRLGGRDRERDYWADRMRVRERELDERERMGPRSREVDDRERMGPRPRDLADERERMRLREGDYDYERERMRRGNRAASRDSGSGRGGLKNEDIDNLSAEQAKELLLQEYMKRGVPREEARQSLIAELIRQGVSPEEARRRFSDPPKAYAKKEEGRRSSGSRRRSSSSSSSSSGSRSQSRERKMARRAGRDMWRGRDRSPPRKEQELERYRLSERERDRERDRLAEFNRRGEPPPRGRREQPPEADAKAAEEPYKPSVTLGEELKRIRMKRGGTDTPVDVPAKQARPEPMPSTSRLPPGNQRDTPAPATSGSKGDIKNLFESLTNNLISSEDDAAMALQVSKALTSALLKYRLKSVPGEEKSTTSASSAISSFVERRMPDAKKILETRSTPSATATTATLPATASPPSSNSSQQAPPPRPPQHQQRQQQSEPQAPQGPTGGGFRPAGIYRAGQVPPGADKTQEESVDIFERPEGRNRGLPQAAKGAILPRVIQTQSQLRGGGRGGGRGRGGYT